MPRFESEALDLSADRSFGDGLGKAALLLHGPTGEHLFPGLNQVTKIRYENGTATVDEDGPG